MFAFQGALSSLLLSFLAQLAAAEVEVAQQAMEAQQPVAQSNSSGPPYTYCDSDCQKQVKILEALILAVISGIALTVGICCMRAVDTPTRFATPKDQRTHQE